MAVSGQEWRLAAKARTAANDRWEDHRPTKAAAGPREDAGAARTRHEVCSFVAPATTELESKDDELAPGGVAKLWVGSPLGFAGKEERSPDRAAASTPGRARRSQGKDQGGVDRHLGTTPKCKSICDDFNAALVLLGGINIEVMEPDVHGHCGTGLSAHAGCSTLEGPASGTKDA